MSSRLNVLNEGILDGATSHDRPQTFTQLAGWWDILSVVRWLKGKSSVRIPTCFPTVFGTFPTFYWRTPSWYLFACNIYFCSSTKLDLTMFQGSLLQVDVCHH